MTKFIRISQHKGYPKSKQDQVPIILDIDSRRFICCDKSHSLSSPLAKTKIFPVNKDFHPLSKQDNQQHLIHRHGCYHFKLDFSYMTDEYVFEKGAYAVIYYNGSVRNFKHVNVMFDYLHNRNIINHSTINEYNKFKFLRTNLLLQDEQEITSEKSPTDDNDIRIVASQSTEKLSKLPAIAFDNQNYKPVPALSKQQMVNLQSRRLKDCRYFLRVSNFQRVRLEEKISRLERDDVSTTSSSIVSR